MTSPISSIVKSHLPDLAAYETLYKHFHAHPELSHQEVQTASRIASEVAAIDAHYDVYTIIGGHGLAAVFRNGDGPTVLLRADIDGLPVQEKTGLPYASKARQVDAVDGVEKPVMHACGHDMHITALLAAGDLMARARNHWKGTLILCFQPAEEKGEGARRMVGEGKLYEKVPVPDVVLGAHLMPFRAGSVGTRRGLMASSADSFHVTIHGRSGHASQPDRTVDPITLAASTILRLQTIVSREVAPSDHAVVTVSSVHAGDAENIIPEEAAIKLNIRTLDAGVREKVLRSMRRIVEAEARASGVDAEGIPLPTVRQTTSFPFTVNDEEVVRQLESSFGAHFEAYDSAALRLAGSEDFGNLATAVGAPAAYWTYGGVDPETWDKAERDGKLTEDIPINHSPFFAPVIQPTLTVAAEAYAIAALTWLAA